MTEGKGMGKAVLNSMWGFWLVLLAISFGMAGGIYFVWLRGNI
jgi:hypothetical protein